MQSKTTVDAGGRYFPSLAGWSQRGSIGSISSGSKWMRKTRRQLPQV
jgi:hypothetical protein